MPTAVVLVDHGSRVPAANDVVAQVARELSTSLGPLVFHAHQESASPTIENAIDAAVGAGATELTVVPFFLAPGRHATEDVPRLAAEAVARHPGVTLRVTGPLGGDVPGLAALALRIVRGD